MTHRAIGLAVTLQVPDAALDGLATRCSASFAREGTEFEVSGLATVPKGAEVLGPRTKMVAQSLGERRPPRYISPGRGLRPFAAKGQVTASPSQATARPGDLPRRGNDGRAVSK